MPDYYVAMCATGTGFSEGAPELFSGDEEGADILVNEYGTEEPLLFSLVIFGHQEKEKKWILSFIRFNGLNADYMLPITCFFYQGTVSMALPTPRHKRSVFEIPVLNMETGKKSETMRILGGGPVRKSLITKLENEDHISSSFKLYYPFSRDNLNFKIGVLKPGALPIHFLAVFNNISQSTEVGVSFMMREVNG